MDTSNDMKGTSAAMVAVVDDERPVLESVADLLESSGYAVSTFQSAQEFLDSNVLPSIACLICDIRMPGMDGWELQSLVHARRPDLPVVLITGHDEPNDRCARDRQDRGGVLLLFKKPFDALQLLVAVSAMVKTSDSTVQHHDGN
jgi:FixJ family two-component response regulator